MRAHHFLQLVAACSALAPIAAAQVAGSSRVIQCPGCAEWNTPRHPFRVFGNTYYVGTGGLSAILLVSASSLVLIDGALPESA